MFTIKKSTLRKTGLSATILLLLALLIVIMTPGQVSLADGEATNCDGGVADGVCSATENSDLCAADCECVDNGVTDPGEGFGCKDVVGDGEYLSSACGTPATVQDEDGNWLCPSGRSAHDGTIKTLSEFNGVCWDACECEGLCTEEDIEKAKDAVDEESLNFECLDIEFWEGGGRYGYSSYTGEAPSQGVWETACDATCQVWVVDPAKYGAGTLLCSDD